MRKLFKTAGLFTVILCLTATCVHAEGWEKYDKPVPTKVYVRVLSHGAKAMSPHTGALVIIKDAATDKVLDKGDLQGSTGDTTALMETGYARKTGKSGLLSGEKGVLIKDSGGCEPYTSNDEAAKFVGVVNISKPTQVVIQVQGPMMPHHAGGAAIVTTWLFPGEDVTGEGIVLELHGLIVDCLASLKESEIDVDKAKNGITVPFYMQMLCGCPIAPKKMGLPWEAEGYKITTQAYYKGKLYHEDVTTSDKLFVDVSKFVTTVPLPPGLPKGSFKREQVKIRVMAAQPELANYGLDEFSVFLNNE